MKRFWMLFWVIACMATCQTVAFAAEAETEVERIDVYVNSVTEASWEQHPVDAHGNAELTLPDGTRITVSGVPDDSWSVIVEPVRQTEAEAWLDGLLDGRAEEIVPFYISLVDGDGTSRSASGVTVSITLPNTLRDPIAYSAVGEDAREVGVTASGSTYTFAAEARAFYVLGEKVSESDSVVPVVVAGSVVAVATVGGGAFIFFYRRRRFF